MKAILNLLIVNVPKREGTFLTTTCRGPWDLNQNPWDFENTETLFWNWIREKGRFRGNFLATYVTQLLYFNTVS